MNEPATFSSETTEEICALFEFGDDAKKQLEERRLDTKAQPAAFLEALLANDLIPDALRFLAWGLPKREAVWWSCQCLRAVADPAEEYPCQDAAESWVRDPNEENRRAAMAAAERVEFGSPDAWAAMGAFWSEGSMAPPDAPVVPPGEALTGQAVSGAVLLAAVREDPAKAEENHRLFAALGVDVLNATNRWEALAGRAEPVEMKRRPFT